jgi:hypothetical protein
MPTLQGAWLEGWLPVSPQQCSPLSHSMHQECHDPPAQQHALRPITRCVSRAVPIPWHAGKGEQETPEARQVAVLIRETEALWASKTSAGEAEAPPFWQAGLGHLHPRAHGGHIAGQAAIIERLQIHLHAVGVQDGCCLASGRRGAGAARSRGRRTWDTSALVLTPPDSPVLASARSCSGLSRSRVLTSLVPWPSTLLEHAKCSHCSRQ